jgi:hypothetical protein
MNRIYLLFGLTLCTVLSGCGATPLKTVPASGVLKMDGKPLEGATVNLYSDDGVVAYGKTDAEGKFSLKSSIGPNTYDGAKVGKHKVSIAKTLNDGKEGTDATSDDPKEKTRMSPMMTGPVKQTFIVPAKYNTPQRSELTCDVPEGGTDKLSFEISSKR